MSSFVCIIFDKYAVKILLFPKTRTPSSTALKNVRILTAIGMFGISVSHRAKIYRMGPKVVEHLRFHEFTIPGAILTCAQSTARNQQVKSEKKKTKLNTKTDMLRSIGKQSEES